MILKITKKDLTTLGKALEKALLHTDYNSQCFSSSDIRHARAFNDDICRVFSILCDNSINIIKDMGKEFEDRFEGYFNKSNFEGFETPDEFEILLYSDAIWRISDELYNLKCSNDDILKVESKYFTKYWSAITHGCICDIVPTKDALLAFSETCDSLKKVLHFVLPEIEHSQIKNIRAISFDNNELELEIQFTKESKEYSLYIYEDSNRADIVVSLNSVPIRIYPTAIGNKISYIFKDDNFCNYYAKIQAEKDRLDGIVAKILNEKLKNIDKDSSKFSELDNDTLDKQFYEYWTYLNRIKSLESTMETLDKDSDEGSCIAYDISEEIDYLYGECRHFEFNIENRILKSITTEYFLDSLNKVNTQHHYMIDKEKVFDGNRFINSVFSLISKYYNVKTA